MGNLARVQAAESKFLESFGQKKNVVAGNNRQKVVFGRVKIGISCCTVFLHLGPRKRRALPPK